MPSILTTHVGSLIRPPALLEFIRARQKREPYDEAAWTEVPARGQTRQQLKQPAPVLEVVTVGSS